VAELGAHEMNPRTLADVDKDQHRLGGQIAQARRRAGLTQKELGDRIGVSLGQVVKLENGVLDPITMLPQIAAAVGQPVETLSVSGLLTEALEHERPESSADQFGSAITKLEEEIRALTVRLDAQQKALADLTATLQKRRSRFPRRSRDLI
jgi:transcriptional regulator with XRE-family HTH domain